MLIVARSYSAPGSVDFAIEPCETGTVILQTTLVLRVSSPLNVYCHGILVAPSPESGSLRYVLGVGEYKLSSDFNQTIYGSLRRD